MMGANSETDKSNLFDTGDDVSSVSDTGSDCSEGRMTPAFGDGALGYEFWTKKPDSVHERRDKFLKMMGLSSDWHRTDGDEEEDLCQEDMKVGIDNDRLRDDEVAVQANLDSEPKFSGTRSLPSFQSPDTRDLVEDCALEEDLTLKLKNLDNGTEFVRDELAEDWTLTTLNEVGSHNISPLNEFQETVGSSTFIQHLLRKGSKGFNIVDSKRKLKTNWFQKFSAMTHIADKTKMFFDNSSEINPESGSASRRVHVNVSKKNSKELSSLYIGQEFHAHEGSILTMKFSPDGGYLASAGVDGIVRVWKVLENEIVNKFNYQDIDPSSLYFSLNQFSELAPLHDAEEKTNLVKNPRRSPDSACVILPPKVFQLSEKPLHEFHGHNGEVLDLSWSKNRVSSLHVDIFYALTFSLWFPCLVFSFVVI